MDTSGATLRTAASRIAGCDVKVGVVEGLVGITAERRDGRDADDDDEGEHHGVFHRRGAVFITPKPARSLIEPVHAQIPFCSSRVSCKRCDTANLPLPDLRS